MKFIHMADMHFDAPFTVLNTRSKLGEKRRLEQREAFKRIIEYIENNNIEYLFIAGDLYEDAYIRETTIEYINSLFKKIPNTKIYITPGNHDPYTINSMYSTFKWSTNVKIFKNNVETVENNTVDIYGYGFNDYYCKNSEIENIKIKNKDKINILITHGTLDGGSAPNLEYNPLNTAKLKQLGFDYIALGHIHKADYNTEENQRIVYPGSTISMGFDELGKHGVILGEIDKEKVKLEFLSIDRKEFVERKIDVTNIASVEELIEKIDEEQIEKDMFYKIILVGKRNFEINVYYLYKFITEENIIKIKDETQINIDINELSKEINLKGLFLKEILDNKNNENIDENTAEKIIEIGLNVLK